MEVIHWLNGEGLSQYSVAFKDNEVNGKTLMSLTDKDLREDLGVNVLGHRKHIIKQIDMYKVCLLFVLASTTTLDSYKINTNKYS